MKCQNRNRLSKLLAALTLLALSTAPQCSAQQTPDSSVKPNLPTKKIIEVGWDQFYAADPAYIRDNIREMEKRPFDGIIFCLPDPVAGFENGGRVFHVQGWNEEKLAPQLKVLSEIKWDKFTDNFLTMFAASTMDWFNDEHWKTVLAHTRFMAQAAKAARCKGLLLDPEPYGDNPWRYDQQALTKTKSLEEYAVQVRQRGRQFMEAIAGESPDLKMLMFYQYSLFTTYASNSTDPIKRNEIFNKNEYGLFAYFLDGMLEAASEKVKFIDGNEFSYYYKNPLEFYRSYHGMRHDAKQAVAPELRTKFDSQTEAAQALYLDYLFNLRPENHKSSPAISMTPEQRLRWFEHNAYYALKTSDEYVWMWSEEFNWYNNKAIRGTAQPAALTAAIDAALVSAKGKIARGEELGFEIDADVKITESKRVAQLDSKLIRRTAKITRIAATSTPTIDGKLNEAAYTKVKSLEPFIGLFNPAGDSLPPQAATRAWVTYDSKNLYISLRCAEPKITQLKKAGVARDSEIWKGDTVDISIQPNAADGTVYHFILSPANVQWDSKDKDGASDLSFNPKWKSATHIGTAEWTVEVAVPWSELKTAAPKSGTSLRVNLARQRTPVEELTSWSQFLSGFQELQNFGAWTFQ